MFGYVTVDKTLVDSKIFTKKFTCDLSKCKGACCTIESEYGAPLEKDEIETIEKFLPEIKKYLSKRNSDEIEKNGFWEYKAETYMTRSINNRDCVFVYYEGDVAKCAIEKAYLNKEIDFQKPISCHLFPIRISDFGGPILKYEEYKDCEPALEKGEETGLSIARFLKEPIIRIYGEKYYSELLKKGEV